IHSAWFRDHISDRHRKHESTSFDQGNTPWPISSLYFAGIVPECYSRYSAFSNADNLRHKGNEKMFGWSFYFHQKQALDFLRPYYLGSRNPLDEHTDQRNGNKRRRT